MSEEHNGRQLPPGWLVYTTPEGRAYFHNHVTGSTQWDEPGPVAPADLQRRAGAILAGSDEAGGGGDEDDISAGRADGKVVVSLAGGGGGGAAGSAAAAGSAGGGFGGSTAGGGGTKKGYAAVPPLELSGTVDSHVGSSGDIEKGPAPPLSLFFFDASFLRSYFDVDTATVRSRLLASALPWRILAQAARAAQARDLSLALEASDAEGAAEFALVRTLRERPDYYGPYWVTTTLIIALFGAVNAAQYFGGGPAESNYAALINSFTLVYGLLLLVPTALLAATLTLGGSAEKTSVALRQLVSVYGYSFTPAVALALVCAVPLKPLQWTAAATGAAVSTLFILFNFRTELVESRNNGFRLAFGAIVVLAQLGLYASFPLYFFAEA